MGGKIKIMQTRIVESVLSDHLPPHMLRLRVKLISVSGTTEESILMKFLPKLILVIDRRY
jgi:hypothetical protein